jgi:8-oxo-dGTP pyrophosphatase MutT (NUDIX family)
MRPWDEGVAMVIAQHREVAAALIIDKRGRFLLQQRDNAPGILFPGKIGLFGGHREGNETFLECVVREVHEEISFFIPPERFERLASYRGTAPFMSGATIWRELYLTTDVPVERLRITEGSLVIAEMDDMPGLVPRFAPSAHAAIKAFLARSGRAQNL